MGRSLPILLTRRAVGILLGTVRDRGTIRAEPSLCSWKADPTLYEAIIVSQFTLRLMNRPTR